MTETHLHYIYDPLCGWCYAASALVKAAREIVPVVALGGGMLAGPLRKQITPQLRDHVRSNDLQIAKLTGQPFGERYLHGLLEDRSIWFDSEPPTQRFLQAEQMGGHALDMLARLYAAHYVSGLRITAPSTLLTLATELDLEEEAFAVAVETAHRHTDRHFSEILELPTCPGSSSRVSEKGQIGLPSSPMKLAGRLPAEAAPRRPGWIVRLAVHGVGRSKDVVRSAFGSAIEQWPPVTKAWRS